MADDPEGLVVIVLLLTLYASISGFASIRLRKIWIFSGRDNLAKLFYLLIGFFLLLRVVGYSLLLSKYNQLSDAQSFSITYSPTSVLVILSFILGVIKFEKTYEGHIASHFTTTFVTNTSKNMRIEKIKPILLVFLVVYILFVVSLVVSFGVEAVNSSVIQLIFSIFQIVVGSGNLTMTLILNRKFSGVPTKSTTWAKRLRRINLTLIFWIIANYFSGVLGIIDVLTEDQDFTITKNQNFKLFDLSLELVNIFLSEVICIFTTIDSGFISIFMKDPEVENLPLAEKRRTMVALNPYISEDQIEIGAEIQTRPNNLGKIFKCTHLGKEIIYRKITLSNVSTYVIEEIQAEVDSYKDCSIEGLVRIRAVVLEKSTVGFIYPFYPNTSFHSLIHTSSVAISASEKLNLLKKIAEILSLIHQENKVHGHLTSHNILIDSNKQPLIADLGFHKLKKYAGIKNQYSYKSAWSCPELLSDNRMTPLNLVPAYDIYSFGMICWEFFSEQVPFEGYSIEQIKQQVVQEKARPKIPEDLDKDLAKLIQSCFNGETSTRPDINLLLTSLK